MKKLIFTLCAVFCAVTFSFEASAQDQEILRLKNGTEITGIIERLPDGGVTAARRWCACHKCRRRYFCVYRR